MDELKPVRVFLEVARKRSFARAAQTLRITPATVTRTISKLEDELGQQLLLRTTRHVALTSAGALMAKRFEPLLRAFDRAAEDIMASGAGDRGALSINAPMSFGIVMLPGLIDAFRKAFPKVTLDVHMTDTLVDIITADCDLSIRISIPPKDKSNLWRKICEVPRCIVASPALLDQIGRPEVPEALDPAYCFSYGAEGTAETWNVFKAGERRSFRAGEALTSNNGDVLYGLAAAGQGMAVLPEFIVAEGLRTGRVERVLPEWQVTSLWLTLFYPPYEQLPPLVATFTEFFETYMRQLDGMDFSQS